MKNTSVEEVYDYFFSKITDYDYLKLDSSEIEVELLQNLKVSLAKFTNAKGILLDEEVGSDGRRYFNKPLTMLEIEVLANWMVVSWLSPKINSSELTKQYLGTKDYQLYAQSSHLKELRALKSDAEAEAHYWMNKYSVINIVGDN